MRFAHVSPAHDTLPDPLAVQWWVPKFPSPAGLDLAARMFDAREGWGGAPGLRRDRAAEEGPRWRVIISAGSFAVGAPNLARAERRYERQMQARQTMANVRAAHLATHPKDADTGVMAPWCEECPADPEPCREITSWSRKSRANMVRALCELDYTPMVAAPHLVPAMVTLTYPGDWLTVAPDGKAAKSHLWAFRKRFIRAWGHDIEAIWKLEFQERGAPHFHLLMVPPHGRARIPGARANRSAWVGADKPFKEWLSAVWADIVDHPDPEQRRNNERAGTNIKWAEGLRMTDPKRVAVYFTKHGSFKAKEYQNCVPEPWQEPGKGPGRFWGYWVLQRVTVSVEVVDEHAVRAARIARRWARAQGTTREVVVTRTKGGVLRPVHSDVQGLAGAQLVEAGAAAKYRMGSTPAEIDTSEESGHLGLKGVRSAKEVLGRHDGRETSRVGPDATFVQPRQGRRRTVRRRVRRLANGRGFISVNNGEEFATGVARGIDAWTAEVRQPGSVQVRLERLRHEIAGRLASVIHQLAMLGYRHPFPR